MKEYNKKLQKVISKFLDVSYPNSISNDKWILIIDPDFHEDAIIKFRKDTEYVSFKISALQPIIEYFPPMRRVEAEEYLCVWFEEKFNVHIEAIDNRIVTTFKLKNFITESQNKKLIKEMNEETVKKVSTNWFKKQIARGEDPHIDGSLLMFLGIKKYSTLHDRLLKTLREFLGDGIYEAAENITSKVFNTSDYPEIAGGYDFQFKVDIVGSDMNVLMLHVDVLPGGQVDLVMTDGGVRDLSDAMWDDEIGMEVHSEADDVIYKIIEQEITDYTGFDYAIEEINYN